LSDGMPTADDTPAKARAAATAAKNAGSRIFTVGLGDVDHALMADIASSPNDYYYTTNSAQLTALFNAISTVICRPPTNIFLSGPTNLTVCAGATATFSVSVTGCMAFRYQWSKDGVNLPGRTNSTLVLNNVVATNAGTYAVAVLSECQNRTNSAMLTVNQPALVVTAPQNQTSFVGSNATFSVGATGTGLSYQWLFNGTVVSTSSTLTLNNLTPNQAGTYCVVVRGTCGGAVTNCATLTLRNRGPLASNDSYTMIEDGVLTVTVPGVLGNDSDPDGDALTAAIFTAPAHGTVTLNPNGSFVYRPAANYTGTDTFTYRANDGKTNSAAATVTITISPLNDAPVARDDAYTTPADTTLTVAAPGVLANDSDVENNPLSALLVGSPTHGSVTLNANGSFTYVPATNYSGMDVFTYKASDGSATSGVATVTITVVPSGGVIVIPPVNQTNCPGGTAVFSVTATGTALTYQWRFGTNALSGATNSTLILTNVTTGMAGPYCVTVSGATNAPVTACATLVVNQNVIVTTPPANQVACPNSTVLFQVGATGTALTYQWYFGANLLSGQTSSALVLSNVLASQAGTYRVVVSGACGVPVTNSVTLTVNPVVAITAPPANQTSFVGSNVVFSVGATGTNLRYQWFFNGSVIGTNSTLVLNNLTTNQASIYCVVVSGTCGNPLTNCVTLTIQNRGPVANDDAYTTAEDTTLTIAAPGVLANDADPDGDTLTSLLVNNVTHGTLILNANGSFVYTPAANFNGVDTFQYRAQDGGISSGLATVRITVTPVNDPPTTGPAGDNYSVLEDQTLTVPPPGVLANDSDIDGDPLTAVLGSGPANGTVTLNANGSFIYVPTTNYFGTATFTYMANDGKTNSAPATVTITVVPVNDRPSFIGSGDQKVNQNAPAQTVPNWATSFSAGPANESSQTVTFIVTNENPSLFAAPPSIAPNGTLTYTPAPNVFGTARVHMTARDNGGTANGGVDTSGEVVFTITVNSPPIVSIVAPANGSALLNPATFTVVADASDPDGTVTNVLFLVNGASFTNVAQEPFAFVMTNTPPGTYQFRAIATDNCGLNATSAPVSIEVITNAVVATGPIVLNHQNGLFEQFVTVSNRSSQIWLNGVRLFVLNLEPTNRVYNATGTNNDGAPYIENPAPVPPGGSVTFVVQYFVPDQRVIPNPTLLAVPNPFEDAAILRLEKPLSLTQGGFSVEFSSNSGRIYYIQSTDDFAHWTTVSGPLLGTGNRMQWKDKTMHGNRFYRVLCLP
ncbi:MAG TPA: tandem-95 repeat protein, partial [Candidatus Limnocylindria bacterium]|nr:tandem-95 repeat protein [Candidatus Limnocylindria bacterium]